MKTLLIVPQESLTDSGYDSGWKKIQGDNEVIIVNYTSYPRRDIAAVYIFLEFGKNEYKHALEKALQYPTSVVQFFACTCHDSNQLDQLGQYGKCYVDRAYHGRIQYILPGLVDKLLTGQ